MDTFGITYSAGNDLHGELLTKALDQLDEWLASERARYLERQRARDRQLARWIKSQRAVTR